MGLTIQNIFSQYYSQYEKTHSLPFHARRAAENIIKCRTATLGGHIQKCPEEHYQRIWYNSCKHRGCTQCAGIKREEWITTQKSRLVDCDYYHVIFTIPHDFNELWLLNTRIMTNLLFKCAKESLFGMLANKDFLGAEPGMIATLQTWGEDLNLHPHIHSLVTAGGLTEEVTWKDSKKGFLVPVKTLMKIFRAKFLDGMKHLFNKGELKIPVGTKEYKIVNLFEKLKKIKWNVFICERYSHGEGVVTYLGRYIKGGPFSNKRLICCKDGMVSFYYDDNCDKNEKNMAKRKIMKLTVEEFIRRFLLHIPEPRVKVVRYYGIYGNKKEKELKKCYKLKGKLKSEEPEKLTWQDYCEKKGSDHPELCPVCGAKLIICQTILPVKDDVTLRASPLLRKQSKKEQTA
jgi:hypothetical protein